MARVAAARVLLSKVLPEISASYAEQHVHHHHDISKLSKAQLRELIGDAIPDKDSTDRPKTLELQAIPVSSFPDLPAGLPIDALESPADLEPKAASMGGR